MLNQMIDLLNQADKHGTVYVLDKLKQEKNQIEKMEYIVKVLEFCDLLEIMTEHLFKEIKNAKLELTRIEFNNNPMIRATLHLEQSTLQVEESFGQNVSEEEISSHKIVISIDRMINRLLMTNNTLMNQDIDSVQINLPIIKEEKGQIAEMLLNEELIVPYRYHSLSQISSNVNKTFEQNFTKI